jgi:2-polyprenyl-3-methyl-5-hydroxy-6-metoxy-1,4-benzoquinol methylase
MNRIHYNQCPVCNSTEVKKELKVKDHSVSGEEFEVWECHSCSLRFTQDIPDEQAIGLYYQSADYISHTNTNKGQLNKIYQRVRKHTLEQKARLIISLTTEKGSVLDIGAGIGAFLNVMRQKGWKVGGIEPDMGARRTAKELFSLELMEIGYFESLNNDSYDAITLWHVLEHVHQLHPYIEKLKQLLKPGGKIFIAVPNYTSSDASIYGSYWAAYDVPRHLYHFTPRSIDILMREHGLKVITKRRMWYDSFYISLLSSKYKTGKTNWISSVINGIRSDLKATLSKDSCSSIIYIIEKA